VLHLQIHSDILQHTKERKHVIAAETKSYSKKVTAHFTKEIITDECEDNAGEEGLFAFRTIKHSHSFDPWIEHPQ
jgi:hypothetical protein